MKGGIIYLFRHGETTYNRDRRFTGWQNARLTVKGKCDAQRIAKVMKGKRFEVAVHTSLSRSLDTLNFVLRGHDECCLVLLDDRMIERSYGDLEGRSHKSVIEEYGSDLYELWHRGYAAEFRPPNGECFADVEKRVRRFIADLKKMIRRKGVNVAISGHGNSIRLFRKIMEKATIEESCSWSIPYDKVYSYEVKDGV